MTEEVTMEVVKEVMEEEQVEGVEGAWLTVEFPGMEGWRGGRGEF